MDKIGKIYRFLGMLKKVRVSEGRFEILEYYKFRIWNPFVWLVFFIFCSLYVLNGIYNGIRECYNEFTEDVVFSINKNDI